jgi:hypothetical protein
MTSIVDLDVDPPQLRGGHCRNCGFVFFPFQTYGCEQCGAYGDSLESRPLAGHGTVSATTVVHRHASERRTSPFRVVQVTLDSGPMVRGVTVEGTEPGVGDVVQLVTLPEETEDELLAVRFTPSNEEAR